MDQREDTPNPRLLLVVLTTCLLATSPFAYASPWGVPYRITETAANTIGDFGQSVAIKDGVAYAGQTFLGFGAAYSFTAGSGEDPIPYDPDVFKDNAYGFSIAVGSETVLVGATEPFGGIYPGAVHLYDTASGDSLGTVAPPDLDWGDKFGYSIDARGSYAVVGAPGDFVNSHYREGSAHVIDLSSRTIVATLLPDDAGDAGRIDRNWFGDAVALTGNHIVVGEPGDDDGKVHVFDASTYQRVGLITAPESDPGMEQSEVFGTALDATDSLLVVGDARAVSAGAPSGVAHVFDTETGLELYRLRPDDPEDLYFGRSVAVSDRYVVVGSPGADNWRGAAYVFDASTGAQVAKLKPTIPVGIPASFGDAVAIEDDVIVVGARGEISVYLFDPERILGDFNGDGAIDAADYDVWRNEFGQTEGNPRADATGDTSVDAADYTRWRDAQQASATAPREQGIPEPAASLLVVGAFAARLLVLRAPRAERCGDLSTW